MCVSLFMSVYMHMCVYLYICEYDNVCVCLCVSLHEWVYVICYINDELFMWVYVICYINDEPHNMIFQVPRWFLFEDVLTNYYLWNIYLFPWVHDSWWVIYESRISHVLNHESCCHYVHLFSSLTFSVSDILPLIYLFINFKWEIPTYYYKNIGTTLTLDARTLFLLICFNNCLNNYLINHYIYISKYNSKKIVKR